MSYKRRKTATRVSDKTQDPRRVVNGVQVQENKAKHLLGRVLCLEAIPRIRPSIFFYYIDHNLHYSLVHLFLVLSPTNYSQIYTTCA